MKLQEAAANATERSMSDLIYWAGRVPEDKLEWHPVGDARTVLNILGECVAVTENWIKILGTGRYIDFSYEDFVQRIKSFKDRSAATDALRTATAELVATIRAVPDERLADTIKVPWGEATTGEWLMYIHGHNQYHAGQICYIQTCYGDWDFE